MASWSVDEDARLRESAEYGLTVIEDLLPGRSRDSIKARARRLGVDLPREIPSGFADKPSLTEDWHGLMGQLKGFDEEQAHADEAPDLTPAEAEAMQDAEFGGPADDFVPFVPDESIDLPDDAPGDDRVDRALMDRTKQIENDHALEWLLDGTGLSLGEATGALISGNVEGAVPQAQARDRVQRAGDAVIGVAKDIGRGVTEVPAQIIGGVVDAAQAALNAIDDAGDTIAHYAAKVGLEDPERAAQLASERNVPLLPDVRDPASTTGAVVRGISQFLEPVASSGGGTDGRYTIELAGGCLGEWLPDGARVVADPSEPVKPLDLCAIAIRDGNGPWARFIRGCGEDFGAAVKIYLARLESPKGTLHLVGQIAPPVVSLIPESEIASLHKVVGSVDGATMTGADREAFALISPLAGPKR